MIQKRKEYIPQIWKAQIQHCKFDLGKSICQLFLHGLLTKGENKAPGYVSIYHNNWRLLIVETEKPFSLFNSKKLMVCDQRATCLDFKLYHALPTRISLHLFCTFLLVLYTQKMKMPLLRMLNISKVDPLPQHFLHFSL